MRGTGSSVSKQSLLRDTFSTDYVRVHPSTPLFLPSLYPCPAYLSFMFILIYPLHYFFHLISFPFFSSGGNDMFRSSFSFFVFVPQHSHIFIYVVKQTVSV